MNTLAIIGGIFLCLVLIFIVYKLLKRNMHVVPQEQRLVIYRLGRFSRVAGPGLVWVSPRLEEVKRTLEVRDHPIEVTVSGIFAFGVPNDLTLNLWCSFDLKEAAGGDNDKLAQFVQVRESERRQQVEVKMREALVERLADLQERMPLQDGATTMDAIIALAPGSKRYNELLAGVKRQLEHTLPTIGVILNSSQPIIITGRGLSNEIIEAMQQKRSIDISGDTLMKYAAKLKEDFPDISDAVVAQILGSIPGVDLGSLQRLLFEKGADEAEVEYEIPGDGSGQVNIVAKHKKKEKEAALEYEATSSTPEQRASQTIPEQLTKRDLSVLKRVPRRDRDQRLSA
jgi:hypothetical protein